MYFENLSEIPTLAAAYSSTIFNLEKNPNIRATYLIEPDEKDNNKIPVEAIREILTHLNSIQTSDIFVVINHAETPVPLPLYLKHLRNQKTITTSRFLPKIRTVYSTPSVRVPRFFTSKKKII